MMQHFAKPGNQLGLNFADYQGYVMKASNDDLVKQHKGWFHLIDFKSQVVECGIRVNKNQISFDHNRHEEVQRFYQNVLLPNKIPLLYRLTVKINDNYMHHVPFDVESLSYVTSLLQHLCDIGNIFKYSFFKWFTNGCITPNFNVNNKCNEIDICGINSIKSGMNSNENESNVTFAGSVSLHQLLIDTLNIMIQPNWLHISTSCVHDAFCMLALNCKSNKILKNNNGNNFDTISFLFNLPNNGINKNVPRFCVIDSILLLIVNLTLNTQDAQNHIIKLNTMIEDLNKENEKDKEKEEGDKVVKNKQDKDKDSDENDENMNINIIREAADAQQEHVEQREEEEEEMGKEKKLSSMMTLKQDYLALCDDWEDTLYEALWAIGNVTRYGTIKQNLRMINLGALNTLLNTAKIVCTLRRIALQSVEKLVIFLELYSLRQSRKNKLFKSDIFCIANIIDILDEKFDNLNTNLNGSQSLSSTDSDDDDNHDDNKLNKQQRQEESEQQEKDKDKYKDRETDNQDLAHENGNEHKIDEIEVYMKMKTILNGDWLYFGYLMNRTNLSLLNDIYFDCYKLNDSMNEIDSKEIESNNDKSLKPHKIKKCLELIDTVRDVMLGLNYYPFEIKCRNCIECGDSQTFKTFIYHYYQPFNNNKDNHLFTKYFVKYDQLEEKNYCFCHIPVGNKMMYPLDHEANVFVDTTLSD